MRVLPVLLTNFMILIVNRKSTFSQLVISSKLMRRKATTSSSGAKNGFGAGGEAGVGIADIALSSVPVRFW